MDKQTSGYFFPRHRVLYAFVFNPKFDSELLLTDLTFFNLPIQFWLTGQFLPLWFIILCALFNFWMDRHVERSQDSSIRFRIKPVNGEDE